MPVPLPVLSARFLAGRDVLFAYLLALVRSRAVAEDLFQDVYLALAAAAERGEDIADLPAWCRGVARNLALRHWREQRRTRAAPSEELVAAIDASFAEDDGGADDEALHRALAACRQALPERTAALLDLRYVHGLDLEAIAARTGRSAHALAVSIARVKRILMSCIRARLAEAAHA